MQARLFGVVPAKVAPAKVRPSVQERAEIMARIQAPKALPPAPDPVAECTFRPSVRNSRVSLAQGEEPWYVALAKNDTGKQAKLEQAQQQAAEQEISECSFRPSISERAASMQAKFRDTGYERYQNKKKDVNSSGGSASPKRRAQKSGSAPQLPAPSSRAEGAHVARAQAARDEAAARRARGSRPLNEAQWQSLRPTTVPAPFCSHTGLRRQSRLQKEGDRVHEKAGEGDKLFKDLHKQLHSLEL